MMSLSVVILAAGEGKRMGSATPKVMQELAGKPMIDYVLEVAKQVSSKIIVVVGFRQEILRDHLKNEKVLFAEQLHQLGTGHAVAQALSLLEDKETVLILNGDVPLLLGQTVSDLCNAASDYDLVVLTSEVENPSGYGRITRDELGDITSIVEDRDADASQLLLKEINTGIMAVSSALLLDVLPGLGDSNSQGECYLTDIIKSAVGSNRTVGSVKLINASQGLGVNDRGQLATVERLLQLRKINELMEGGVTVADPSRVDIRGELLCGKDVFIDVNTVFAGRVILGDGVTVASNNVISDSKISAGTHILPNCVISNATIDEAATIGPFTHLRPQSIIEKNAKIGNFVEIKKSTIGSDSKVNHLSYVGDTEVGTRVNIGAGTITCNYDGENKNRTVIKDGVFVGSGSQLVAPVTIGYGAVVGAGSTITDDVEPNSLAVSRPPQKSIPDWLKRKNPKKSR